MLWELIRKELHSSIITARFIVGFVICLMLISASTYVAIRDYDRRLNDYNVASREHRDEILKFRTYSQLVLRVDRRPSQLSIFSQGMDKRLGNTFEIRAAIVPAIYDGWKHGAYNPFLALFPSIDLTFIFQVVLSLLALLCACDTISGERENGTLKLMMSNSIPRSYVLLGKYLSALLLLSWPIVVSIIFALLMVMFSGSTTLNASHLLRVLLIVVVSLLYISLFFLIGLLISAKTRRTATSLMLTMLVWVFLNLVYPNAASLLADRFIRSTPAEVHFSRISELWSQFNKEKDKYREKVVPEHKFHGSGGQGSNSSSAPRFLRYFYHETIHKIGRYEPASAVEALKHYYGHVERLRITTADRTWQIRKRALDESYGRKQRLTMHILRLSPTTVYNNASAILAGIDLGGIQHFMDQLRNYRQTFISYLDARKAFSSVEWFLYADKSREHKGNESEADPILRTASTPKPLGLDGIPVFHQRGESIASSLSRAAPDIVVLIMLNVVFFMLSHMVFVRQEFK
jgi:ABC-type transport system involved in multi-copper enzyme maturation permease subunit